MAITETPKKNQLDTNAILRDRKVDEKEAKQTSEYINKTKKFEVLDTPNFKNPLLESTKEFLKTTSEEIRKITDPKQLQEKSEAVGHYLNIIKNMENNTNIEERKQIHRNLVSLQKDIDLLLKDPDLQEKGHNIFNQSRFQNRIKSPREVVLKR